jgi:hypothetical protein
MLPVHSNKHDGKVVSVCGDKMISVCADGREHHHTLATKVTVSCDGQERHLSELAAGMSIRVTTSAEDGNMVTAIEIGKTALAAPC